MVPALGRDSPDRWVACKGCDRSPGNVPVNEGTSARYEPCDAGVVGDLAQVPNQRHLSRGGLRNAEMRNLTWELFDGHVLPS